MGEEWRVTLIFNDLSVSGKRTAVRDLLRQRLGEGITVSGGKSSIFLYAGAASAAEEAVRAAQDVLVQEGLVADIQLEYWDPARKAWRDPRAESSDDEDKQVRRASMGGLIETVLPYLGEIRLGRFPARSCPRAEGAIRRTRSGPAARERCRPPGSYPTGYIRRLGCRR
jgi:hypothetical protein